MIVWGGVDFHGDPTHFGDGAAFDPRTGQWRSIAPAPIAARTSHSAVWTGTEMIVWGGLVDTACTVGDVSGAAYDPGADTWRVIATPTLQPRIFQHAVWTGTRLVVLGGLPTAASRDESNACPPPPQPIDTRVAAAYDPTTDTWEMLSRPPWQPKDIVATAEWDGERVLVWGGMQYDSGPDISPWLGAGYSYDLASDQWADLPAAPLTPRDRFSTVWTGAELIVVGGQDDSGSRDDAAAYDPTAQRWRVLANAPVVSTSAMTVWTGEELVLLGGCCADTAVVSYDPIADEWRSLPDVPISDCAPIDFCATYGPDPIWTGTAAIVWGGMTELLSGEIISWYRDDGASLRVVS